MDHGTIIIAAIFGLIGQWFKAHPKIPNAYPQGAMLLVGLVWYAGNHGLPATGHGFMANFIIWTDWLEVAMPAAAGINGAASLFSLIPAIKTRTEPNP